MMFKGIAIALLILVGSDQLLNRGQVTDSVAMMLRQIAQAYRM